MVSFTVTWPTRVRHALRGRDPSPQPSHGAVPRREPSAGGRRAGLDEQQARHPAMARIDVSPVHGYHCDCERCRRSAHAA
jgi:hypothetical protein